MDLCFCDYFLINVMQSCRGQKTVIFRLFSIFSKTVHTIRTKISTVIVYTKVWSRCAISINSYNWDWSESEGKRPKPTSSPHMRLRLFLTFKYFFTKNFTNCLRFSRVYFRTFFSGSTLAGKSLEKPEGETRLKSKNKLTGSGVKTFFSSS